MDGKEKACEVVYYIYEIFQKKKRKNDVVEAHSWTIWARKYESVFDGRSGTFDVNVFFVLFSVSDVRERERERAEQERCRPRDGVTLFPSHRCQHVSLVLFVMLGTRTRICTPQSFSSSSSFFASPPFSRPRQQALPTKLTQDA